MSSDKCYAEYVANFNNFTTSQRNNDVACLYKSCYKFSLLNSRFKEK